MSQPTSGEWFKSSFSSGSGSCVEVRFDGGFVSIRDSKQAGNDIFPIIMVSNEIWCRLLAEIATGRSTASPDGLMVVISSGGEVTLQSAHGDALVFDGAEWDAFRAGVVAGEFRPPEIDRLKSSLQKGTAAAKWVGRALLAWKTLEELEGHLY